ALVIDSRSEPVDRFIGTDVTGLPCPGVALIRSNSIPDLTTLLRRSCFDAVGPFEAGLVYNDWRLWVDVAVRWPIRFVETPLADYRIHGNNTSVGIRATKGYSYILALLESLSEAS